MSAEERLSKLFVRGGVNFSIETINTKDGPKVLITISRLTGSNQETVGGTYDSIDEGINHCIDQLDKMATKRIGLKVVKKDNK